MCLSAAYGPLLLTGLFNAADTPGRAAVDTHVHVASTEYDRATALFDEVGIDWALNLSGGWPTGRPKGLFERQLREAQRTGRLLVAVNLPWRFAAHPRFVAIGVELLRMATAQGARALKIEKALGITVRDADRRRMPVDSPRLDPIWEAAGQLGLPVVIHTADPRAFWEAPTPDNERYAELTVHPGWSYFQDATVPSFAALLAELERVVAKHPDTIFVSVHFGNHAEDPWAVEAQLDRYPNLYVDLAARVVELGRRDPKRLGALFARHADRILFGTDLGLWPQGGVMLGSTGDVPDTDADVGRYYDAHWRWLETSASMPSPVPIQGRWRITGLELSPLVLDRIYRKNAEILFGPPPARAASSDAYPPFFRRLEP